MSAATARIADDGIENISLEYSGIYGVVYCIRNTINGKCYIGQTTQGITVRVCQHFTRKNNHTRAIAAAVLKYGRAAFESFEICAAANKAALDEAERSAIAAYDASSPTGYNLREGGSWGTHSDEARGKISLAHKGRRLSPDHVEQIRQRMLGSSPSEETRRRISATLMGRSVDPDAIRRGVEKRRGRKHSDKAKMLMSKNRSGIPVSEEMKIKLRQANLGKQHSAETRAKMTASQVERWRKRRQNLSVL